jgi:hypothetical protein
MKQITKISSLNISPEACCRKVVGVSRVTPPPCSYFLANPGIFHLKTTYPLFSSSMFPGFTGLDLKRW